MSTIEGEQKKEFVADERFSEGLGLYMSICDLDRIIDNINQRIRKIDRIFLEIGMLLVKTGNYKALKTLTNETITMHRRFHKLEKVAKYMVDIRDIPENTKEYTDGVLKISEEIKNTGDYYINLGSLIKDIVLSNNKEDASILIEELIGRKELIDEMNLGNEAIGLKLSREDLMQYFTFEGFREYIESRVKVIPKDVPLEDGKDYYGVFVKDNERNEVQDIRLCVPEIVDLNTYLINAYLYEAAYNYYEFLGYEPFADEFNEICATTFESRVRNSIIPEERKRLMKF